MLVGHGADVQPRQPRQPCSMMLELQLIDILPRQPVSFGRRQGYLSCFKLIVVNSVLNVRKNCASKRLARVREEHRAW